MRELPDPGRDNDTVSPTPAQQARAAAITAEITARLAAVNLALPGPAAGQMTRCGHRGRRRHAGPPQLHGSCHQQTRKKNGKTATPALTGEQAAGYPPGPATTAGSASSPPDSEPSASPSPRTTPARTR